MITLLFCLFLSIRSIFVSWPNESHKKLHEITYELLKKGPCNLEALNACSLKSYMLSQDDFIMDALGQFHLFGFPDDEGHEYLEFCTNYGGFSVPRLSKNESMAAKYFKKSKSSDSEVFLAFMEWNRFKRTGKLPLRIHTLFQSLSPLGLLAYFNYHYNCQRFQNIDGISLSEKFSQLYSENLCWPCQALMQIGVPIAIQQMLEHQQHREELEINKQDYVLLKQMAENGNEQAQLQYAYSLYAGNTNLGVQRNEQASLEIFANMSSVKEGAFNAALLYRDRKQYDKAVEYFRKAIALGDMPEAQHELGNLYLQGLGVEQDKQQAEKLFREAMDAGFSLSKVALGQMLFEKNVTAAMEILIDSTESQAKMIMIAAYFNHANELEHYGCDKFLNMTRELILLASGPKIKQITKNFTNPNSRYKYMQFAAFVGMADPVDDEEAALFGIPGAATRLAHKQSDVKLRRLLYQRDLSPESYISLSQLEFEAGDFNQALFWVNRLIRESLNDEWEFHNLLIAYAWKMWLYILSL